MILNLRSAICKKRANRKRWSHKPTENPDSRPETECVLLPPSGMSISLLPEQPNPPLCCKMSVVRSLAALIQSRPISRLKPDCVPNVYAFIFPSSSCGRATNHVPCSHCVVGVEAEDGGRSHLQVLAGPPGRWDAGCLLSCLEL